MRILHFGTYSVGEGYPRNAVVAGGLRRAGAEVIECRRAVWKGPADKERGVTSFSGAIGVSLRFLAAWAGLAWSYLFSNEPHDLIIVGYSGHLDVFLARALAFFTRKPVVLDAFFSLYEAVVEDRKLASPMSIRARLLRFLDRASSRAADMVLLDTDEHIGYYRDVLGIDRDNFVRVFVGGEDKYFYPQPQRKRDGPTEVLFFGSFLPLHGADVIVKAIESLANETVIHFTFAGDGPEWEKCRALATKATETKITWLRRWVHYDELASLIGDADICLGIFGSSPKALRVIPCKVFNVLAMGRPLITADTPAAREALTHEKNALLVKPGDPDSLAAAILELTRNAELRNHIAAAGLATYKERFSEEAIGRDLIEALRARFALRLKSEK